MKKIDDFFAAGIVIGCISNILFNIDTLPLILIFGDKLRYPWNDLVASWVKDVSRAVGTGSRVLPEPCHEIRPLISESNFSV